MSGQARWTPSGAALGRLGWRDAGMRYLPVLLAIIGLATALIVSDDANTQRYGWSLAGGGVLFAVALALRQLDQPLCPYLPTGTHFAWHLINAVVLYLVVCLLGRRSRCRLGAASPLVVVQLFDFLVAEDLVEGNPMAAVGKPRRTPDCCLRSGGSPASRPSASFPGSSPKYSARASARLARDSSRVSPWLAT